MTILFIGVVILALWIMYDTGELMSEKMRLQNTADNVAYSSAALVSRDLNFIAYTNRAMAANQVAIGQLVGISSWTANFEQFAVNVGNGISLVPILAPFGQEMVQAAHQAGNVVDNIVSAVIPFNDHMIGFLSKAQFIFHQSIVLQLATFSSEIAHKNDPQAISLLAGGGASFTEAAVLVKTWNDAIGGQYELKALSDGGEEAKLSNSRFRDFEKIVQDSRDPFSKRRSYEWGYPFTDSVGPLRWKTKKYGGSEFFRSTDPSDNEYRWDWAGMDDAELRAEIYVPFDGWKEFGRLPLAWGAAHAFDSSHESETLFDYGFTKNRRDKNLWGNGTWRNSMAARLLLTSVAPNPITGDHVHHRVDKNGINGLRDFYEFRSNESTNEGPAIISMFIKNKGDISSQRSIMTSGGGKIVEDLDTEAAGTLVENRISAVAKAQPYYFRPTDLSGWRRKSDNKVEYGNLYNPYWQPRLVDLSDAEKITAITIATGGIRFN